MSNDWYACYNITYIKNIENIFHEKKTIKGSPPSKVDSVNLYWNNQPYPYHGRNKIF